MRDDAIQLKNAVAWPNSLEKPEIPQRNHKALRLAKRIGISLPKAYDWIEEGLPSMKIGRERLVQTLSADAWLKAKLTGQGGS